ncbi:MAG: hypothetical protein J6K80_02710, partial [Oscillospiraceae bacterium]|nr:hypothetical protein [Oscillospiraceae bacterium]
HLLQKNRGQQTSVFYLNKRGIEPERVAALNKQSGGLFVASESLSGSESQLAFAAGKGGDSHHLLQKTEVNRPLFFCKIYCLYWHIKA